MLPQNQFSPLFKIKRILLVLRCLLGFPLKAVNNNFNEFTFQPWIEFPRYALFLVFFFAPQIYNAYLFTAYSSYNNMFPATKEYFSEALGYTNLDIFIVMWFPWVCLLSTIFYMVSFKKNIGNINQVCLKMTNIKKILSDYFPASMESKIKSKRTTSFGLFISALLASLLTLVLYCASIHSTIHKFLLSIVSLTPIQLWIFTINVIISSCCWIYPTVSMSADLVTCVILEDMGNIFQRWETVLAFDQRIHDQNQFSVGNHTESKENKKSENKRYIL